MRGCQTNKSDRTRYCR
ncbi:hypothetical protein YPPY48_1855, partial [Yersinia pestis PY-48]